MDPAAQAGVARDIRVHPIFLPSSYNVSLREGWTLFALIDIIALLAFTPRWAWDHAGHVGGSLFAAIKCHFSVAEGRQQVDVEEYAWHKALWFAYRLDQKINTKPDR
jgi:hypothetical protein